MISHYMRRHNPVMLQEMLDSLPDGCEVVLDGTL